jgi:hypothetical protein
MLTFSVQQGMKNTQQQEATGAKVTAVSKMID